MVDTAVRPRPGFGTFLHSDANVIGDGLSFHEYKRLLRANKVRLLQEKRAGSYEPGYKKTEATSNAQIVKRPAVLKTTNAAAQTTSRPAERSAKKITINAPTAAAGGEKDSASSSSFKVQQRLVKSATTREHTRQPERAPLDAAASSRPLTAGATGGIRSSTTRKPADQASTSTRSASIEDIEDMSRAPSRLENESFVKHTDTHELNREELIKAYCWSTSTQRAYKDISWENKLPPTPAPPPVSTLNNLPDPVSLRFTNKRNELTPRNWQNLGASWDWIQTRYGNYYKPPNSNTFCSPCKNTQQIPGYFGYTGHHDNPETSKQPSGPQVSTMQPRPTNVVYRPNIPGYTGIVHWTNNRPAHSKLPVNHQLTTRKTHRTIPCEDGMSPFIRTSHLSKMISLTAPYNPYNKVAA